MVPVARCAYGPYAIASESFPEAGLKELDTFISAILYFARVIVSSPPCARLAAACSVQGRGSEARAVADESEDLVGE